MYHDLNLFTGQKMLNATPYSVVFIAILLHKYNI